MTQHRENSGPMGSKAPLTEVCCICGGVVTMWAKGMAHVDIPEGKLSVSFHKACEDREIITNILNEIIKKNRPKK